jgi:uncharacterized protein YukE
LLLVVILALVGTVFWQRQAISDWIQLYGYEPPSRIAALADQTTMTAGAEHLFYLNRPVVASKTEFASFCTNPEQTIVLGCYHSGQNGIYILSIANKSELNGVMQVTAAHEMLHAAYDRLSPDEKLRIDKLLQTYYDGVLKNAAIKAEIDAYRKTEPGQLLNEMHSIFGTEVANLPAELESYYVQYFTNRRAVVTQAESYQAAFRKREAAVEAYDIQLSNLQAKISHNEALLTAEGKDLAVARAQLDASKSSGDIASYNAAVPTYNSAVRTYNALLETTKQQIAQFNAIVSKRNALVVEEQALVKQLSGESLPGAQ